MPVDELLSEFPRWALFIESLERTPALDLIVEKIIEHLHLPILDRLIAYILHGAVVTLAEAAVAFLPLRADEAIPGDVRVLGLRLRLALDQLLSALLFLLLLRRACRGRS